MKSSPDSCLVGGKLNAVADLIPLHLHQSQEQDERPNAESTAVNLQDGAEGTRQRDRSGNDVDITNLVGKAGLFLVTNHYRCSIVNRTKISLLAWQCENLINLAQFFVYIVS